MSQFDPWMNMRKPSPGQMPPLQIIVISSLVVFPAVLATVTDEKCKCFMCVCDLDPHPLPPELPVHHHPPPPEEPVHHPPPPSEPETVIQPPPAVPEYHYHPPPYPYGYPWDGSTYYGPPAGEMYPRDKAATKSGAPRRGGHGLPPFIVAVALAFTALAVLARAG